MQTIEALQGRIGSAQDLLAIARTMKVLAAVQIQQYDRAVASLADYSRSLEMGLQVLMRNRPPDLVLTQPHQGHQQGVIVCGSDQGLCGQFNEACVTFAVDSLDELQVRRQDRAIVAVGARAALHLQERHQPLEAAFGLPSVISGVTDLVQQLLSHLDGWQQKGIGRVLLFYNRPLRGGIYRSILVQLLPVDLAWLHGLASRPWPGPSLPTFTLAWDPLFSALVRQHLFVSLFRALAESMASENASRLVSMQAAERNIGEQLDNLNAAYHHLRQSTITAELLDIVAGFEALQKP